jgi:hypothetical protein
VWDFPKRLKWADEEMQLMQAYASASDHHQKTRSAHSRSTRPGPRHKPKVPFLGGVNEPCIELHLTISRLATFTEHARPRSGV